MPQNLDAFSEIIKLVAKEVIPEFGINSLMPRRPYSFPVSRDWEDVDCKAAQCKWNKGSKCITPSIAVIGDDGRCKGFELDLKSYDENKRKIRVDGD